MKIVIKTMGCKANRYESERLKDDLSEKALIADAEVCNFKNADMIIVNTCTVTHVADRKSRQAISHMKKLHPDASVVVFGCGVNVDQQGYKKLPNVDHVFTERKQIEDLVNNMSDGCEHSTMPANRTRALVKIQDGCNNFCSYCIVPYARGREKSKPHFEILEEVNQKVEKGFKEIVLTGINIGAYNHNNHDLAELIESILNETKVERLRLSSIEPHNFSEKFYRLFENPRFCPHLHISLQSGCDKILKSMNRRYSITDYEHLVKRLRKVSPNMSITTDVIVGFPGETEGLFNETINFVKKIKFSKIHIFPYSKRKGTIAADMSGQVSNEAKKGRCAFLSEIEKQMRADFYEKNIGDNAELLVEKSKDGFAVGFTKNYLKTRVHGEFKDNEIIHIALDNVDNNIEMIGKLKS
jgi:threonylcarbamoyladenosine tRNA methylthiotransferase MtaB